MSDINQASERQAAGVGGAAPCGLCDLVPCECAGVGLPRSLFARAKNSDPITSHEAADRVVEFEGSHYAQIWQALDGGQAMTPHEIGAVTGLEFYAVAKRLPELEQKGCVERHGYGVNPSGRRATKWGWVSGAVLADGTFHGD
jgi:hypothetical protein